MLLIRAGMSDSGQISFRINGGYSYKLQRLELYCLNLEQSNDFLLCNVSLASWREALVLKVSMLMWQVLMKESQVLSIVLKF